MEKSWVIYGIWDLLCTGFQIDGTIFIFCSIFSISSQALNIKKYFLFYFIHKIWVWFILFLLNGIWGQGLQSCYFSVAWGFTSLRHTLAHANIPGEATPHLVSATSTHNSSGSWPRNTQQMLREKEKNATPEEPICLLHLDSSLPLNSTAVVANRALASVNFFIILCYCHLSIWEKNIFQVTEAWLYLFFF